MHQATKKHILLLVKDNTKTSTCVTKGETIGAKSLLVYKKVLKTTP